MMKFIKNDDMKTIDQKGTRHEYRITAIRISE